MLLLLDPAMNSDNTLGLPGLCRLGPRALQLGLLLLAMGLLGVLSSSAKRTAKLRCLLLDFDNPPRELAAAEPSVSLPASPRLSWLQFNSKTLNELLWSKACGLDAAAAASAAALAAATAATASACAAAAAVTNADVGWHTMGELLSRALVQAEQLSAAVSPSCDCSMCEGSTARIGPIWLAAAVLTAATGS
jgi:hypothetical protein